VCDYVLKTFYQNSSILSGSFDSEFREETMSVSIEFGSHSQFSYKSGYLTKPVRQSQLYDCIALVLSRASQSPLDQPSNVSGTVSGIITRHTIAENFKHNPSRILLAEDNIDINSTVLNHAVPIVAMSSKTTASNTAYTPDGSSSV